MKNDEELKACGHCGNKARRGVKEIPIGTMYRVVCSGCRLSTGWYATQPQADKKWNTRTPDMGSGKMEDLDEAYKAGAESQAEETRDREEQIGYLRGEIINLRGIKDILTNEANILIAQNKKLRDAMEEIKKESLIGNDLDILDIEIIVTALNKVIDISTEALKEQEG